MNGEAVELPSVIRIPRANGRGASKFPPRQGQRAGIVESIRIRQPSKMRFREMFLEIRRYREFIFNFAVSELRQAAMGTAVPLDPSSSVGHVPKLIEARKSRQWFLVIKMIPVADEVANHKDLKWDALAVQERVRVAVDIFIGIVERQHDVPRVRRIVIIEIHEIESSQFADLASERRRRNPPNRWRDDINLVVRHDHGGSLRLAAIGWRHAAATTKVTNVARSIVISQDCGMKAHGPIEFPDGGL